MDNIVKTEIKLSEESVKQVIIAEVAKVLMDQDAFVEKFVGEILFYREKSRYSSDPPKPTMFEKVMQQCLEPIVKDEIKLQFQKKYKKKFQRIVATHMAKMIGDEESAVYEKFEQGVNEAFSKFHYYVRS